MWHLSLKDDYLFYHFPLGVSFYRKDTEALECSQIFQKNKKQKNCELSRAQVLWGVAGGPGIVWSREEEAQRSLHTSLQLPEYLPFPGYL